MALQNFLTAPPNFPDGQYETVPDGNTNFLMAPPNFPDGQYETVPNGITKLS
jgi:hypothetical protein